MFKSYLYCCFLLFLGNYLQTGWKQLCVWNCAAIKHLFYKKQLCKHLYRTRHHSTIGYSMIAKDHGYF